MKYIKRTSKEIKKDFLKELLMDRNIIKNDEDFCNKFFNPTINNLLNPLDLDNMDSGFQMLKRHLDAKNSIYLIIDPDIDGFTSAAILYNYLTESLKDKYDEVNIEYHIPDGKAHGLESLMSELGDSKKYDLLILPDSSSNDYDFHEHLKHLGYDILCIDHHESEEYSKNAIVINNQLSKNYQNKSLSGVGVVYKFLQYCDKQFSINASNEYLDLVAIGMTGDMMNLNTLENRFLTDYGLSHLKNKGFREMVRHQAFSLFRMKSEEVTDKVLDNIELYPIQIAFYIAPLVNALIRVGNYKEKELLFKSFIEGDKIIPSTKRGCKGEYEKIGTQSARNCTNARNKQNREKEKAMELLNIQITNNCLDNNKILILNGDELDVPNTLTGLCAMGIAAEYKKPVLLGRVNNEGYFKGSIRGCDKSELKDFKKFLLDSGYMEYVEGHAAAAGFSMKVKDIDKLYQYANKKLENIDFNEGFYEVDFCVSGNCSYLEDMIFDLDKGKKIYGQDCPEPLIYIDNINIPRAQIQVIGSNKDTLKFTFNGITYIKFFAKELIEKINQYSGSLILTVIGKQSVSTFRGITSPQILIEDIEIEEANTFSF